jgi:hypothetical protein
MALEMQAKPEVLTHGSGASDTVLAPGDPKVTLKNLKTEGGTKSNDAAHAVLKQIDGEHGSLTITDSAATVQKAADLTTEKSAQFSSFGGSQKIYDADHGKDFPNIKPVYGSTGNDKTETYNYPDGSSRVIYKNDQNQTVYQNIHRPNNSWEDSYYDPKTGHPTRVDRQYADGTMEYQLYRPGTENLKTVDRKFPDNHTEHNEYDANGKRVSCDQAGFPDGHNQHDSFDTASGKRLSTDLRRKDGTIAQHWEYGADGKTTINNYDTHGKLTSADIIRADNSTQHDVYDANEKLISVDERWTDGGTSSRVYDPVSGKLLSDYIHYADNTIADAEFDPTTGNLKTQDIVHPDGTREHHDYDPATGKEIPETWGHALGGLVDDWLKWMGN